MRDSEKSIGRAIGDSHSHFQPRLGVRYPPAPENAPDRPVAPFQPTSLTDASGNPSESYFWSHYGRVMDERRLELIRKYISPLEPTFYEIIEGERVARELLYS